MPAVVVPMSKSVLFKRQAMELDLLHQAAQQLNEAAQMYAQPRLSNEESKNILEQMVRICLGAPRMLRDLWEWMVGQDSAGNVQNRALAGKDIRESLCAWLDTLDVIHKDALTAGLHGYAIHGTADLQSAADEIAAIGQQVNQTWPIEELPEPEASTMLSYEQLRKLADQPIVSQWPDEDFDPYFSRGTAPSILSPD
jgi:hypothetical protein